MHGERGQGTIEYLAVVLVVAAAMAAAIALVSATGLGEQVFHAFRRALCVVTGGACDNAVRLASGPCVLSSQRRTDGDQLTVAVIQVGDRNVVLREDRSDGTTALTLVDGDSAGLDFGTGVGVRVRWGKSSLAVGGELRAAMIASSDAGRTWIVRGEAQVADRLMQLRVAAAFGEKFPLPDADVTFSERGTTLTLDLQAGNRQAISLSAQDAYGERIDNVTGRRTVYVRDVVGGRGKVSFGRVSASADGEGEERLGITYDRNGRPIDLMVLSTVDIEGAAGLPRSLARIAGYLRIPLNGSKHLEIEQHLDLTDPLNAEAAQAFLGTVGENRLGVRLAAEALRDRLERRGTLSVRTYATDASAYQVGGHAKLAGVGVGGQTGSEEESARLVSAVARRPDGSWGRDDACLPV